MAHPSKTKRRALSVTAAICLTITSAGVATLAPTAAAASNSAFIPTELTRIVDTRTAVGLAAQPRDDSTHRIQVTGAVPTTAKPEGDLLVPAGATAVVVNMTAVDASTDGFFVGWTTGAAKPTVSNVNFTAGETVAGGAVIALAADGSFSVFTRGDADLLVDIAGYYTGEQADAADTTRLLDTREDGGKLDDMQRTAVRTRASESDLVTLNLTVDRPSTAGFAFVESGNTTATPAGGVATFSNLNWVPGDIISNTVQVTAGAGGYVTVETRGTENIIVDQLRVQSAAAAQRDVVMLPQPVRRMDTRADGGAPLQGHTRVALQGDLTTLDDPDYVAAIVNVTATEPQASGFVSIGANLPRGAQRTSVINVDTGVTRANLVMIPADYAGSLDVFSNVPAHVIVDVVGYTRMPAGLPATDAAIDTSTRIMTFSGEFSLKPGAGESVLLPVDLTSSNADTFGQWRIASDEIVLTDRSGQRRVVPLSAVTGTDQPRVSFAAQTFGDADMLATVDIVNDQGERGLFSVGYQIKAGGGSVDGGWILRRMPRYANPEPALVAAPGQTVNLKIPAEFESWKNEILGYTGASVTAPFAIELARTAPDNTISFALPLRSELMKAAPQAQLPDELEVEVFDSASDWEARSASVRFAIR